MLAKFTLCFAVLVGAWLLNALPQLADLESKSDDELYALVLAQPEVLKEPSLLEYLMERAIASPKYGRLAKEADTQARGASLESALECKPSPTICVQPEFCSALNETTRRLSGSEINGRSLQITGEDCFSSCCSGLQCVPIIPFIPIGICLNPKACAPNAGEKVQQCQRRRQKCSQNLIGMKWTGRGCTIKGRRMRDGGCQCDGYCGYTCKQACKADKQCFWGNDNICRVAATGLVGAPIPICMPNITDILGELEIP